MPTLFKSEDGLSPHRQVQPFGSGRSLWSWRPRCGSSRLRSNLMGACGAIAIAIVGGCTPPPPPPPVTTASVNASTNFPAGGASECSGNATWTYVPEALTGSGGVAQTVTHAQNYYNVNSSGGLCTFGDYALNLRTGQWLVEVSSGFASGSCTETLHVGTNVIGFNYGSPGCSTW